MTRGIEKTDYVPSDKDYRRTPRSEYVYEILEAVKSRDDGTYKITENEFGEPFPSVYAATLFAQALRGAASRVSWRRNHGINMSVNRRGTEVFVTKKTEEALEWA